MTCTRTECFYCAKGSCVSLSVLSSTTCEHACERFLHKKLSRRHPIPNRRQLSALRRQIEAFAPPVERHVA